MSGDTTTIKAPDRKAGSLRVAVYLVVALLLAGCGGKKTTAEEDDGYDAFGDFDLDADGETGVIRGVVVDANILPLKGATVTIQGDARSVKTNQDGAFGFGNLTAGTYFLHVSKLGYYNQTPQVTVQAGVAEPPVTKIVLDRDELTAPYVDARAWTGFVQCSLSGFPICRPLGDLGTNENSMTVYAVAPGPKWVQSEMQWVPQQQVTDELWLWHGVGDGSQPGFGALEASLGDLQGASPLILFTSPALAAERGQSETYAGLGVSTDLVPFVLGGSMEETRVLCSTDRYCGGVGFTFEQEFTVYTHLFYRYAPPEGWVFSRDGVPTP